MVGHTADDRLRLNGGELAAGMWIYTGFFASAGPADDERRPYRDVQPPGIDAWRERARAPGHGRGVLKSC